MIQLTQAYAQWKRNVLIPEDDRQLTVLKAYEAFLSETPHGKLGSEIPAALDTLWEATFE